MDTKAMHLLINLIAITFLSRVPYSTAVQPCLNCGRTLVPYPLSTGPGCGEYPLYKIRCTAGTLFFDALNGSSYPIIAINPVTQRITIRPTGISANACIAGDYHSRGIQLDRNLPFRIAAGNTIFLLNCTDAAVKKLRPPLDCSANSECHKYIKDKPVIACMKSPVCCAFRVDGKVLLEYGYGVSVGGGEPCAAYESFAKLELTTMKTKRWPEPEMELEWDLPKEPICKNPVDCKEVLNSKCLADPVRVGQKRCMCDVGFKWDPITGLCQNLKCTKHGKGCKIKKKKKSKHIAVVAGVVAGVVPLLIGIGILVYKQHSKLNSEKEAKKTLVKEREQILNSKSSGKSARIFTGKEIAKATNNFSKSNLIGSGGFGEVFKGVFDDGTVTAIKRAKLGNTKGIDQILNEVRILCQVNHRSLVRLLGCCVDLETPLLISEFVPNGTLFDHLHRHSSRKLPPLSWRHRLRIAHQTAEGLAYLHSAAVPPIYHRDIKSSNILLDEKFDAKVSDFGLSRLVEQSDNQTNDSHIFTCAQGTLGYLDPEYYRNFQLTDKSDVYSFGVVLLEILTAMKAIDFSRQEEDVNLVVYVKKMMKEERLMEAVDPALKDGSSKLETEAMKGLGLLASACLSDQRQNRPSMKEVADEIEYLFSISTTKTSLE
ncbi:wall-associated receptor kinase-like 20 [Morus notabilis]|uniref:wall-associated receptor kinase-like 20 n=1 Tax=Morus notabilis TaxID=981085 RepID=UPI000CED6FD4|nr:wall-associated receptor kinase-like 20 [Morus notabilis]